MCVYILEDSCEKNIYSKPKAGIFFSSPVHLSKEEKAILWVSGLAIPHSVTSFYTPKQLQIFGQ